MLRILFIHGAQSAEGHAAGHRLNSLQEAFASRGARTASMCCDREGVILRGGIGRQILRATRQLPWSEFDFLHVAGSVLALACAWTRKSGAKVVFDCHGLRFPEMELNGRSAAARWVMERVERRAARDSGCIATVSQPLADVLAKWRGRGDDIALVRNGVDLDVFVPSGRARRQNRFFIVGYAGAFQSYQAVDLLVDAARQLPESVGVRWRLIGFGPSDTLVRERLAQQMPAGTELISRCDRLELRRLLDECDLLVIPRKPHLACRVALPTKFAEFIAMGKPVLVNTVDETSLIVAQTGCGLVADPNGSAMAAAIGRAAELSADERGRMGVAGREYAERELAWSVIGARYHRFLERQLD